MSVSTFPDYHTNTSIRRTDGNGIEVVVGTLRAATKDVLRQVLPTGHDISKEYIKECFKSVWIGLAGLDRSGFREALAPKVSELFGLPVGNGIRLTNDVDLLVSSMAQHPVAESAIVVIAGTGSVSMRYTRKDEEYVRVARSGGWGHILGDEGGGYAIGLQAIKHTLTALEEKRLGLSEEPLGGLEKKILRHFGYINTGDGNVDLLTELLVHHPTQSIKNRIAGVAEVLLGLVEENETAAGIIDSQAQIFVDNTLGRLLNPKCVGYAPPENSGLILSGSVMNNSTYKASVLMKLASRGIQFQYVETVNDAVLTGARYLAAKAWPK